MAENYKHLYEQTRRMLEEYQNEIVPGLRKIIEDSEKEHAEIVRCKECVFYRETIVKTDPDDLCSYGERREGE